MFILTHEPTGSAYCLLDNALFQTPLYEDLTFDTCTDNWCEVEYHNDVLNGVLAVLLHAQELDPEYVTPAELTTNRPQEHPHLL